VVVPVVVVVVLTSVRHASSIARKPHRSTSTPATLARLQLTRSAKSLAASLCESEGLVESLCD
jgi:hypothetical protein